MENSKIIKLGNGIHLVDVEENIYELFELDERIASASPALLPIETPEKLIDFLLKEHKSDTYALVDDGIFAGYLSVIDTDAESMEVLNLGIDPNTQGKGLGKRLMIFAEDLARNLGKKKITLVTNIKNEQAVNFYKAIGYMVAKELEDHYGDGETRYLFEKEISTKNV